MKKLCRELIIKMGLIFMEKQDEQSGKIDQVKDLLSRGITGE